MNCADYSIENELNKATNALKGFDWLEDNHPDFLTKEEFEEYRLILKEKIINLLESMKSNHGRKRSS